MEMNKFLEYDESKFATEVQVNGFTVKALYRLGFKWSIIDMDYLKKTVEMLKTLGFFER